jgi:hypothetical protein
MGTTPKQVWPQVVQREEAQRCRPLCSKKAQKKTLKKMKTRAAPNRLFFLG